MKYFYNLYEIWHSEKKYCLVASYLHCQNQETTVCIAISYVCTTFKKSKSELPRKLAGIYEKVLTSLAVKNGVRLLSAWGKKVVA